MLDGYIKLWRRMLDSEEWRRMSDGQVRVLVTVLLMADWKAQPGTLTMSYGDLADTARVSVRVVRNSIARLVGTGFLRRGHSKGTVNRAHPAMTYVIEKWEDYQRDETVPGTVRA